MTPRYAAPLLFAVVLLGCIEPKSKDAQPAATTLQAVAEQTGRDYLAGMADLCEATAKDLDAGKFKAQSQVADQFKAANDALRKDKFGTLGKRFDQDVPPGQDLSAADTAKAYRAMGAGLRKASGK